MIGGQGIELDQQVDESGDGFTKSRTGVCSQCLIQPQDGGMGGLVQRYAEIHQHSALGYGAENRGVWSGDHGSGGQKGGNGNVCRAKTSADLPGHFNCAGAVAMDADRMRDERDRITPDHWHQAGFQEAQQAGYGCIRVMDHRAGFGARHKATVRQIATVSENF